MTDPEPTLAALPSGVRLALASQRTDSADVWWMCWRIFDGEFDIGGVDYWTCQRCRLVLLGEIGIIDSYQRRGIGRDVLEHLRARLPGYRWRLTLTKPASRPARLQQQHPARRVQLPGAGVRPHHRRAVAAKL